jgi:hypothetical protein
LKLNIHKRNSYRYAALLNSGRRRDIQVHSLVLLCFVGARGSGQVCRHLDGDPSNNRLSNLVWGTPAENHRDRIEHGNDFRGSKNPRAKLTGAQVLEGRRLHRIEGIPAPAIAARFGMNVATMKDAIYGRTWKHLPMPDPPDGVADIELA